MTYVYRDTKRLRRHPVVIPRTPPPTPHPAPAKVPDPPTPEPSKDPAPKPKPKKKPKPLPPPLWGGHLGLELAYFEVCDWERRNPRHQQPERADS